MRSRRRYRDSPRVEKGPRRHHQGSHSQNVPKGAETTYVVPPLLHGHRQTFEQPIGMPFRHRRSGAWISSPQGTGLLEVMRELLLSA